MEISKVGIARLTIPFVACVPHLGSTIAYARSFLEGHVPTLWNYSRRPTPPFPYWRASPFALPIKPTWSSQLPFLGGKINQIYIYDALGCTTFPPSHPYPGFLSSATSLTDFFLLIDTAPTRGPSAKTSLLLTCLQGMPSCAVSVCLYHPILPTPRRSLRLSNTLPYCQN